MIARPRACKGVPVPVGLVALLLACATPRGLNALSSSLLSDGTVVHGGEPFFPLGLYAENEVRSDWQADAKPIIIRSYR